MDMHKLPPVSSLLKMSIFCQEVNISSIDTPVPSSFFKIIKFHRQLYSPNTSPRVQRHYIIYGFVMTHTEYLAHFLAFLLFQQYLLPISPSLYFWVIRPLKFIEKLYRGTTRQCNLGINEDLEVQKRPQWNTKFLIYQTISRTHTSTSSIGKREVCKGGEGRGQKVP